MPAKELDIDNRDEVIQVNQPLEYDFEVQKLEDGLLIQGRLELTLACECVRCLKKFEYPLKLEDWTWHLPLEGEDRAPVVNDLVDLTPYVREDILLAFPQHPLCDPECGGLPKAFAEKAKKAKDSGQAEPGSAAWAELNKLKF